MNNHNDDDDSVQSQMMSSKVQYLKDDFVSFASASPKKSKDTSSDQSIQQPSDSDFIPINRHKRKKHQQYEQGQWKYPLHLATFQTYNE